MIVELIVIGCVGVLAYIAGNITGWTSGKEFAEEKARFEALINQRFYTQPLTHVSREAQEREELIDHISRQSLAFSQKQKQWIKVYDAEIE
jgi:hypothetical protein